MRTEDIARIKMGESEMVKWKFHVGHLSKDRTTNRLWFTSVYRKNLDSLLTVHITQLDSAGRPITRWYADSADYDARQARWILWKGKQVQFDSEGNVTDTTDDWTHATGADAYRTIDGWTETPFRLASTRMDVEQLGVAELNEYLKVNSDVPERRLAPFRTHLQHRFAVPFTCFTVIFIAAPLGIVFSRRAVLASVASSILIFFVFLFSTFLFLALGKGNHISPFAAAWTPNIALMLVGLYLLYLRSTNREAFEFLSRRK
jgi:lipopolysaccharide export system permease protein